MSLARDVLAGFSTPLSVEFVKPIILQSKAEFAPVAIRSMVPSVPRSHSKFPLLQSSGPKNQRISVGSPVKFDVGSLEILKGKADSPVKSALDLGPPLVNCREALFDENEIRADSEQRQCAIASELHCRGLTTFQ